MGITLTKVPDSEDVWGKHRNVAFDVLLDSSYPAGGYPISAANVGLGGIESVQISPANAAAGGYTYVWDTTNKTLRVFQGGTGSTTGTLYVSGGVGGTVPIGISSDASGAALSKSSATDRSGITGIVLASVAGVAGAEVGTGASLAGVTVRARFFSLRD